VYDCLQSKERLAPWSEEEVAKVAEQATNESFATMASKHTFLRLAQPTRTLSNGKVVANEVYRRPDRLAREPDEKLRTVNFEEIFNQNLECVELEKNGRKYRYADAPAGDRAALFTEAIEKSRVMTTEIMREYYQHCGRNCGGKMQKAQLSKPSEEDFADWIAAQAMDKRLARIGNMKDRREASALGWVAFCEQPGLLQHASDLAAAEGQFSYNVHSEHRDRRIGAYTKNVRNAVNCTLRQGESSRATCER